MTQATAARALECLRGATAVDPAYGLAWAGIADTYSSLLFNSDTKVSDVATDAREAATQAVQHGGAVAEAHCAVGTIHLLFDWDWPAAEKSLRRAIALDSSSSQSYWMLGHALSLQGRHADASDAARRARDLDPLNPLTHSMSAQIAFSAHNMDEAARHALDAIRAEPNDWVAHWQLGQAYERMNRVKDALEEFTEASRLSNGNTKPISVSAYTLARSGRTDQARQILEDLEGLAQQRYVPPCALAVVHAGLNEEDQMLECLERALAVRDVHLIYLPHDSKWDSFRSNERLKRVIQLCGFSPPGGSAAIA
jgi:tetratricopeptide (TPR) repeat protein